MGFPARRCGCPAYRQLQEPNDSIQKATKVEAAKVPTAEGHSQGDGTLVLQGSISPGTWADWHTG